MSENNLRKFGAICLAIITLIMLILIIAVVAIKEQMKTAETLYPMTTKVIRVSKANDTVTVEDFNGNLWQFKGTEDWYIGDICSCIMDNNGTPEITDDEIIKTRYNGWLKNWAD